MRSVDIVFTILQPKQCLPRLGEGCSLKASAADEVASVLPSLCANVGTFTELCRNHKLFFHMAWSSVGLLVSECEKENLEGESKMRVLLCFCQSVATKGLYACVPRSVESSALDETLPGSLALAYIKQLTLEPYEDLETDGIGALERSSKSARE